MKLAIVSALFGISAAIPLPLVSVAPVNCENNPSAFGCGLPTVSPVDCENNPNAFGCQLFDIPTVSTDDPAATDLCLVWRSDGTCEITETACIQNPSVV